jgi:hypothetical protein
MVRSSLSCCKSSETKNTGYIYARQTEHEVIVHLQHCLRPSNVGCRVALDNGHLTAGNQIP